MSADSSSLLEIAQLITAFGLGGFVVAVYNSRKSKAASIANMRQQWIDNLRSDLAGFFGQAILHDALKKEMEKFIAEEDAISKGITTSEKSVAQSRDEYHSLVDRFQAARLEKNVFCNRILLKLNPFELDHIKLEVLVRSINGGSPNRYRNRFRLQCRKVLKKEWRVVNSGKMSEDKEKIWDAAWELRLEDRTKLIKYHFNEIKGSPKTS